MIVSLIDGNNFIQTQVGKQMCSKGNQNGIGIFTFKFTDEVDYGECPPTSYTINQGPTSGYFAQKFSKNFTSIDPESDTSDILSINQQQLRVDLNIKQSKRSLEKSESEKLQNYITNLLAETSYQKQALSKAELLIGSLMKENQDLRRENQKLRNDISQQHQDKIRMHGDSQRQKERIEMRMKLLKEKLKITEEKYFKSENKFETLMAYLKKKQDNIEQYCFEKIKKDNNNSYDLHRQNNTTTRKTINPQILIEDDALSKRTKNLRQRDSKYAIKRRLKTTIPYEESEQLTRKKMTIQKWLNPEWIQKNERSIKQAIDKHNKTVWK